jgi:hypothetical protein
MIEGWRIEFHGLRVVGWRRIARRKNIQSLYLSMEARTDFWARFLKNFREGGAGC